MNHGLVAGRFTVQPGGSDEHGNVVVSCPAGGRACVVNIATDGTATYDKTGGVPAAVAAYGLWDLPSGHGLAAGTITVQPGASDEHGNVMVSCPAGGRACVVNIATDGTATYDKTGGVPAAVLSRPEEFPVLPPQGAEHAVQAPIVALDGTLHVGSDAVPDVDQLMAAGTHNGVAVSYGQVRDGVGADNLIAYLNQQADLEDQSPGFQTFSVQPTVRLTERAGDELADYLLRAIQLINAALPHERRILFSSDPAPPRPPLQISWGDVPNGQIFVDFSSPDNPGHPPGTAYTQSQGSRRIRSYVVINPAGTVDALEREVERLTELYGDSEFFKESYESELERIRAYYKNATLEVLVHELVHAIGMNGHSDPTQFPHSVMHAVRSGNARAHILSRVDREALLASHSALEPGASAEQIVEDLGPWDDTSIHIHGELDIPGGPVAFGVAASNGLAQPWALGPAPWTDLADNPLLSETVIWSGRLLGFTPAVEAVGGAADLAVELETLDGQLDFTGLEHWGTNAAPGPVGSGTVWGDGDLNYLMNVHGNIFVQTGGDEGTVTGAFFGAAHEAMGGVLERTDLTAGFGGKR